MDQTKYWRVVFAADDSILDVVPLDGPEDKDWVIVEAETKELARKKAYNLYCARKKKAAKTRLHKSGRCACGRVQDRYHSSGVKMLTCSTCAERQQAWTRQYKERVEKGTDKTYVRDEAARVASNLARQRDRKSEIRLEVLLEVRAAWQKASNNTAFTKWLKSEIESLAEKDLLREYTEN